jgi:hypothetical protein
MVRYLCKLHQSSIYNIFAPLQLKHLAFSLIKVLKPYNQTLQGNIKLVLNLFKLISLLPNIVLVIARVRNLEYV